MLYRIDHPTCTIVLIADEQCSSEQEHLGLKPMKRVTYIAASWKNRFKLREIRRRLQEIGINVSSQWIDLDREYADGDFGTEADRDYGDIDTSDFLILDTTDQATKGGREWEAGYATGLGLAIYRVGPIITPFHARVDRSFEDWDSCISWFATEMEHAPRRDN